MVVLWLSQGNSEGPRARSRVRVEGEKGAGFVPEHAFAVNPGGVVAQDPEGGACQSRARASGRGRQRLPVPNSWAVARRRSGSSRWSRPAPQGHRGLFIEASR